MGKSSKKTKKYSKNKILNKIESNSSSKFEKMGKILDKKKEYNIKINKDKITLEVYQEKNKILVGDINFYGIIKPDGQFLWSYMIPGVDKRFVEQVKKIKSFSHLFENSDDKDMLLYHAILTQDSILLNKDETKKLLDLILYLSEDLYFFVQPNSTGNLQLIFLSSINEQYV